MSSSPKSSPVSISLYSSCQLPTEYGTFEVEVYRADDNAADEHLLMYIGDLSAEETPFVRVHSECYTGEVLASLKCDCRAQLQAAMRTVSTLGCGAIAYLRQEGRGIGLGNKIRAYAEQAKGADTIEANTILGFPVDMRDYSYAAQMLTRHGISQVVLNTNNPEKVAALERAGISVQDVTPSACDANVHNVHYLRTKHDSLGHLGLRPAIDEHNRNTLSG